MAKRSKQRKKMAPTRVLHYKRVEKWTYAFVAPQRFIPCYTEEQRDEIALVYSEFRGGMCYNGPLACLEGIEASPDKRSQEVRLTTGWFYDFIACNIVGGMPDDKFLRYCRACGHADIVPVVDKLMENFRKAQRKIRSFEDVLDSSDFPHVLAMSGLVRDEGGIFLLSKRSQEVLVGQNLLGVTVTGSVEMQDLSNSLDPFRECAARELAEETGIAVPDACYSLRGFSISTDKLQPAAMVDIVSPKPLSTSKMKPSNPDGKELSFLIGLEAASVADTMVSSAMTAIAREHCRCAIAPYIEYGPQQSFKSVDEFFLLPDK